MWETVLVALEVKIAVPFLVFLILILLLLGDSFNRYAE